MTTLAPVLQAFFTERLMAQRRASSHTITGYRDTLRLLVGFLLRFPGYSDTRFPARVTGL